MADRPGRMFTEQETYQIQNQFEKLKDLCREFSPDDAARFEKAFNFASKIYGDHRKPSGEPVLLHGLAVARIVLEEMGLRTPSAIAALLHDVSEISEDALNEIENHIGRDISVIVRGFKRISKFSSERAQLQSENFRSLFLSLIDDVRIIFIKMAHRLYDLRNFHLLTEEQKKAFLNDVQYLYIPIAHRIGLYEIKAQLEDLSFKYTHPEEYAQIESRLNETREQQEEYIRRFTLPIIEQLNENKIRFEIKSRAKSIASIRRKMEKQGIQLDQVYDLFAVRIILTDVLNQEELEFVQHFIEELEKAGYSRIPQRIRRWKDKEDSLPGGAKKQKNGSSDPNDEIQQEIREQEYKAFEARRKRFLELLNREKNACWQVYSLITNIYPPNPKRLRDWITTPKDSGYESLHTTVLGPDDRWVEVQIRTLRMDIEAEKGTAAHWKYKEAAYGQNVEHWMLDVRNMLESIETQKFDDTAPARIEVPSNNIYVFTPKGDLRELKAGATVLDFAFDIHSDIGCKCIGAKINGKIYPIRHQLNNGDTVEIITSKNQRPHPDWLNIVVTSKAKNRIARAIREEKFKEAEVGKEILYRKFKNWKIELNDRELNRIMKFYGFKKPVDLFFHIANGKVDLQEAKVLFKTSEEIEERIEKSEKQIEIDQLIESQSEKDLGYITIEAGVSNLNYSLARCCNPIAGDRIFGFVTVNHGIKIHRYDCPNAEQMLTRYPYRIIKARWKETSNMKFFVTNLRIIGIDRIGLVNDITKAISEDLKVNMKSINFQSHGTNFEGLVRVQVRDVEHLNYLRQKLLKIKGVIKVGRFD